MLKADRSVFGKLVGAATSQLMALCQKRNSNHCVNMSPSELTLTILGTDFSAQQGMENSGEECLSLLWFVLLSVPPRNSHFVWGNRDIFCKSVHMLLGYFQVLFKNL